jgi:hypothetical protein
MGRAVGAPDRHLKYKLRHLRGLLGGLSSALPQEYYGKRDPDSFPKMMEGMTRPLRHANFFILAKLGRASGRACSDQFQRDGNRVASRIPKFGVIRNDARHAYLGIRGTVGAPRLCFIAP